MVIANVTGKYVGYSPPGFKFGLIGNLLVFADALLCFVAAEAGFGATIGKFAAGVRVLGDDGGPAGLVRKPNWTGGGRIPSWDGFPLDVDVILPHTDNGPWPTLVMLHPWGTRRCSKPRRPPTAIRR